MKTKEQVYRELDIPKDKEPFEFSYTVPVLDWYDIVKVKINPEDYYYFHLERRYGPSWHLIGCNPIDEYPYWKSKDLGCLGYEGRDGDVKRFIEWAKTKNGSRITQISTLCGSMDIFKAIQKLLEDRNANS